MQAASFPHFPLGNSNFGRLNCFNKGQGTNLTQGVRVLIAWLTRATGAASRTPLSCFSLLKKGKTIFLCGWWRVLMPPLQQHDVK